MLSIIDIIRSLSSLIESNFPDYPVNDRDLSEGYPRPSYYVDVAEVRGEMVTSEYIKEESDIELYFFAEDRYQGFLDLLDMKNDLIMLLSEPLAITDNDNKVVAHVTLDGVNATVYKEDKALKCTFTSTLVQDVERKERSEYIIENIDIAMDVN